VVVGVVVVALLASLAGIGLVVASQQDTSPASQDSASRDTTSESGTRDVVRPPDIRDVVQSLNAFWEYSRVPGLTYTAMELADVHAGADSATGTARCGTETVPPDELADNAWYCPDDDTIFYDPNLFDQLGSDVGVSVPALVLAHEWGHRIQALSNTFPETSLVTELQADCYAGAWSHATSKSKKLDLGDDPLLDTYRAAVVVADGVGLTADDPLAHGTGFDRAGAMLTGWDGGAASCVELGVNPPATVQGAVAPSMGPGNLPFGDVVPVGIDMLDAAYPGADLGQDAVRLDGCDGQAVDGTRACDDKTISVDQGHLRRLYQDYGDMAAWVPIIEAYLEADGKPAGPGGHYDCEVGALAQSMLGEGLYSNTAQDTISLSSDDLDEILYQLSFDTTGKEAFTRISKVRAGFEGGWAACGG
jgi:predicted metalloprotease